MGCGPKRRAGFSVDIPYLGKQMQRFIILTLCLATVFIVGCSDSTENLNSVFGGSAALEILQNATSVNAFRLATSGEYHARISDYEFTDGPVVVPADSIVTLRSTLLDASSYEWDSVKGCIPNYGVRIQFKSGLDEVDVLFCFECDILAVYYNGVMAGGEDFDNARGTFLSVVKELFPDDIAIQQL